MCNCAGSTSTRPSGAGPIASATSAAPAIGPAVPLAAPIGVTPDADGPLPGPGITSAELANPRALIPELGLPGITVCRLDFRDGCYAMTFRPAASFFSYEGTLRVDRAAPDGGPDNIIVSGDLYTKPFVIQPFPLPLPLPLPLPFPRPAPGPGPLGDADASPSTTAATRTTAVVTSSLAASASVVENPFIPSLARPRIPIFARTRYHSYLKATSISAPFIAKTASACKVTLVIEQFNYTQPPAGQHKGTFPGSPSRTVTVVLTKMAAPFPYSLTGGPYYEGRLFEGVVDKGAVTLAWVSQNFRRATVEIDTLAGAVAPAPVPDGSGGTEFFDTIFAKIGWQLSVVSDQVNIPVPVGVTPTNCWSSANLHALMTTVRNPATNLDAEWRVHLVVVPAQLGCSRGVMYDQIGVPREGCASFSDDGYPSGDSSNFGAAQNQMQRNVPRAYLRSATHEVTHTFNQIHQEQETAADNSIMTTTPSVADVLGGPATGAPGIFPDQINLGMNTTVRHHLNHMPDPVIRPGGWPFGSWFPGGAPQSADRQAFSPDELELAVRCEPDRVVLGQPVTLSWTLTNRSAVPLIAPNDISTEALFATITVANAEGREQAVRPFVIVCDAAKLAALDPGQSVSASSRVFWSSAGFAFERPGRYRVTVAVDWSAGGVPVGVAEGVDVFIEFPTNDADNQAAGLVLHPEVGKWVALGGDAYHLPEASRRLNELTRMMDAGGRTRATADAGAGAATPRLLAGFEGLLPSREGLAVASAGSAGVPDDGNGADVGRGSRTAAKRPRKPR